MSRIVGVDFGGTWMRLAQVDPRDERQVLEVAKYPSPQDWDTLVETLKCHSGPDTAGYGVAVSGPIEDHATLVRAPNIAWLNGRNLRKDLEAALGQKVIISNDMEAATEGELARGVLQRFRWAIFDTISTGWGGNLVLDGRRIDAEPGHANVSFDVPERCGAGHRGCYEALYSGSALDRKIRKRIARTGESHDDPWVYFQSEVAAEDPWALSILDDWAEGVGRAWGNTLNRIRPIEAIVYMGTTAENLIALPRVQERLRETLGAIVMFPQHQADDFPIVPATYANRSVVGAVIVHGKFD